MNHKRGKRKIRAARNLDSRAPNAIAHGREHNERSG